MVTITYFARLGKYGDLLDFFNPTKIAFHDFNSEHVRYVDTQGGESIMIRGDDLDVNKHGVITSGVVNEIDFNDKQNHPLIEVTNIGFDVQTLSSAFQKNGLNGLLDLALSGNDTITGSLIADYIYGGPGKDTIDGGPGTDRIEGGKGNDTLTGGKQSDQFIFHAGDGKDTITDFDAKGGHLAQDYIKTDLTSYEVHHSHGNTVVDFGGGDSITLLHVAAKDFDAGDFIFT